jgi:hypothetical protein
VAIATEIVGGLRTASAPAPRLAALALFGMMNWIYTWYRTPGDQEALAGAAPGIDEIAGLMSEIFLHGFMAADAAAGGLITTTTEKGQG